MSQFLVFFNVACVLQQEIVSIFANSATKQVQSQVSLLTNGVDFKEISVKVSHHGSVGCALLVSVVERSAARTHRPNLVGPFIRPREDVWGGVAIKAVGKTAHHTFLNKIACLHWIHCQSEQQLSRQNADGGSVVSSHVCSPFLIATAAKAPSNSPVSGVEKVDFFTYTLEQSTFVSGWDAMVKPSRGCVCGPETMHLVRNDLGGRMATVRFPAKTESRACRECGGAGQTSLGPFGWGYRKCRPRSGQS